LALSAHLLYVGALVLNLYNAIVVRPNSGDASTAINKIYTVARVAIDLVLINRTNFLKCVAFERKSRGVLLQLGAFFFSVDGYLVLFK
jgi:hypothetical protein